MPLHSCGASLTAPCSQPPLLGGPVERTHPWGPQAFVGLPQLLTGMAGRAPPCSPAVPTACLPGDRAVLRVAVPSLEALWLEHQDPLRTEGGWKGALHLPLSWAMAAARPWMMFWSLTQAGSSVNQGENVPGCLWTAHPLSLLGQAQEKERQCQGWLKGQVDSGAVFVLSWACLKVQNLVRARWSGSVCGYRHRRCSHPHQSPLKHTSVLSEPAGEPQYRFIPHLHSFGPTVAQAAPSSLHSPPELRVGCCQMACPGCREELLLAVLAAVF